MSKKDFLEKLEKKLSVLNDQEKQDIIIEYTDIINEKIKHGQTEEEAVKDFGNLEDLSKEILSAYKINPDYDEKEETLLNKGEELIKEGASKIADITKKGVDNFKASNGDIKIELVIEIVIKIFIVLIALAILKGIFNIFKNLGESIFNGLFSPIGEIFATFWNVILIIVYIICMILLIIAMFKKYFKTNKKVEDGIAMKEKNDNEKMDIKEEKKEIKKTEKTSDTKDTKIADVLLLIVKILVILWVVVPLIISTGFSILGFVASLIYLIKGIDLLGLVLLIGGIIIVQIYLIKIIFNLLFDKFKPTFIPIIIGVVMAVTGGFMFADMILGIDYKDKVPSNVVKATETKEFTTTTPVYIHHYNYDTDIKRTVDNLMLDNQFKLVISYNKNYENLVIDETNNYKFHCDYEFDDDYDEHRKCNDNTVYKYINIYSDSENDFNEGRKIYNQIIKDLKNNEFYNYNKIFEMKIEIIANENTHKIIDFE